MGFLIDTCIWVDVERGIIAPSDVAAVTGNEPVYISPVTISELKFSAENAGSAAIRQRRLAALAKLKKKPVIWIDETTGEIFGDLAAQIRKRGYHHSYRVQDLWIASQAIQHGFQLLTHNRKDFEDVPGLNLLVWEDIIKKGRGKHQ